MTQSEPYMFFMGVPYWEVTGVLIFLTVFAALGLFLFLDWKNRPKRLVQAGDTQIELRVKERAMPGSSEGILVPVATDLRMSSGIAKWVRDRSAGSIQYDALEVAPLEPGSTFIGGEGKYKFQHAALCVVMDDQKRTSAEWITKTVADGLWKLRELDCNLITIPDMTEDLLRQPTWISDEQRRETCRPIARAIMDGIMASQADAEIIRIWVWRGNEDIWQEEFDRIAAVVASGHIYFQTA